MMMLPFPGALAPLGTLDPHWWLKKKHKTHFATSKNAPGKPPGWYDAMCKLKAEYAAQNPSLTTVEVLTDMAIKALNDDAQATA